ncbi:MAG: SPOR domain-containing protein [Crocinitomicaceae bacterium]|nr:SPOR domain-containing protein [Crocinitomicaceae bacterium]
MKTGIICLTVLLCALNSFSQDTGLSFSYTTTDSLKPVVNSLDYSSQPGHCEVIKDNRIDNIAAFVRAGEESVEGVKIDGYRVLIFFDMSKTTAEQQKAYFMTMYTEHKAYIDYMAPNYRVRVGNFRTQLEAERLKQELIALFPTAIVVPDKIQLPVISETTAGNK